MIERTSRWTVSKLIPLPDESREVGAPTIQRLSSVAGWLRVAGEHGCRAASAAKGTQSWATVTGYLFDGVQHVQKARRQTYSATPAFSSRHTRYRYERRQRSGQYSVTIAMEITS